MDPPEHDRLDLLAIAAGAAAVLAVFSWLASWTGPSEASALPAAAHVLLTSGPWVILWVTAALGWGWLARRLLLPDTAEALSIQAGLGTAILLLLDSALGSLGALQWGGGAGAWILLGAGLVFAALASGPFLRRAGNAPSPAIPLPHWLTWTAAPALAVLLLAACSAPGWLWRSEFGGYDALSYHLELPKEWLAQGRLWPVEHNVYSFLPGYLEAAYYHLAILVGDAIEASYACQLLHAAITVVAALVTARLAARLAGGRGHGAVAAVVMLGTPWVVVAGSLAYNESAVLLLGAAAGLLLAERAAGAITTRVAFAIGLLAGAACGVKLTAAGFVAAPLGLLLLFLLPRRQWFSRLGAAAGGALLVLLPWLLRNGAESGNPIFPMGGTLLGYAHWTADQAGTFLDAHRNTQGAGAALAALRDQVACYGLGPSPGASEPWAPQWSILPWITIAALGMAMATTARRRAALGLAIVLGTQVLFWMAFTHLKSRFLLPAVVPAAAAVSLGVAAARQKLAPAARPAVVGMLAALAGAAWSLQPMAVLAREASPAGRVGWADIISGDGLLPADREAIARQFHTVMVNHGLPQGARVLLVGDAAPFYLRGDVTWCTVWDRGPMSAAVGAEPGHPRAWFDRLAEAGYTHLLIDASMLALWKREGWGDPHLDPDRLLAAASLYCDAVAEFPDGRRLFRIR